MSTRPAALLWDNDGVLVDTEGLFADQCLVIEDSERGLRAARAAGLRCWVVPSPLAREGSFVEAERVFASLGELAAALRS